MLHAHTGSLLGRNGAAASHGANAGHGTTGAGPTATGAGRIGHTSAQSARDNQVGRLARSEADALAGGAARRSGPSAPRREPNRRDVKEVSQQLQLGRILRDALSSGAAVESRVVGGELEENGLDKHVEYVLQGTLQMNEHSRRFTEFKELDAALRMKFPALDLPSLPEVSWRFKLFSRRTLDPAYVSAKGKLLDKYLQDLSNIREVRESTEFLAFLFCQKRRREPGTSSKLLFRSDSKDAPAGDGESGRPHSGPPGGDKGYGSDTLGAIRRAAQRPGTSSGLQPESEREVEKREVPEAISQVLSTEAALWETARLAPGDHPFISKLVGRKQPVSLPMYSTWSDLESLQIVILHLDKFDTDICLCQCSFEGGNSLSGIALVDGHRLRLAARLVGTSPLRGAGQFRVAES